MPEFSNFTTVTVKVFFKLSGSDEIVVSFKLSGSDEIAVSFKLSCSDEIAVRFKLLSKSTSNFFFIPTNYS